MKHNRKRMNLLQTWMCQLLHGFLSRLVVCHRRLNVIANRGMHAFLECQSHRFRPFPLAVGLGWRLRCYLFSSLVIHGDADVSRYLWNRAIHAMHFLDAWLATSIDRKSGSVAQNQASVYGERKQFCLMEWRRLRNYFVFSRFFDRNYNNLIAFRRIRWTYSFTAFT